MSSVLEKRWLTASTSITGISDHIITVTSTKGFHTKQIVVLNNTGLPGLTQTVKRILSPTQLQVGDSDTSITAFSNPTAYSGGTLTVFEQERNKMGWEIVGRAVYQEEPAVALRNLLVDENGNPITHDNPLPVQVDTTVNIGDVRITAQDNDPNPGNVHSSVRLSDGTDQADILPDGSLKVFVTNESSTVVETINQYNEISAVASGTETLIVQYTALPGKLTKLQKVQGSGGNISLYKIYIDGVPIGSARTYFGGDLNFEVNWTTGVTDGLALAASQTVEVTVIHNRPFPADYEARIQLASSDI